MSHGRLSQWKPTFVHAILLSALPLACAVGVEPAFEDSGAPLAQAGGHVGASGGSNVSIAGTASSATAGQTSSAAAGSASTAGKPSSGTGGASSNATAGAAAGGKAGASGAAAGGASGAGGVANGGAGGSGAGCACPAPITWADNTVHDWKPGDCFAVDTKKYLYVGAKPQNYMNIQCNPAKQEPWCTDSGNDYKFMACE